MVEPSLAEESIFAQAQEISSASERAAFLDRTCGGNVALRAAVEALLRASRRTGDLLDLPDKLTATVDALPVPEAPGAVIGPYTLLESIGEGGFGVVFMAEQSSPVRRKVAVKVLKPGMDSRQVVARFEAERQALAIMDHPNIARVFDGGATDSGRPFFVMELVKGVPITDFCDRHHLTPRQRLELFLPVCQAVQHAHQKGIIHRDLKPSNILVVVHDTTPVPKVIDFGIAKALGQELTDKTLFTGFEQMVGTPLYMSPEQAGQSGLDIDTRSDIYSLGVLLYELLTGTTPFSKDRFKEAAFDEIRRIIREEEPPRPSTRLSDSKDSLPSISAQRQTEPSKLAKLVRGDLDWIVMKALEKERGRRYETANGFAMDVQRYLADEAVQACPPSMGYRLRKFVRRNRRSVLAASVIALALVVGIIGTTWGMLRANKAETNAVAESEARGIAIEARNKAIQTLHDEQQQTRIKFSTELFDKGLEFCERGEVDLGLLWFARSLENAPTDAEDLQRVIRANLAGWSEQTALVKAVFHQPGDVVRVAFRPDGRTLVAVSETAGSFISGGSKASIRVWDSAGGKPLGSPIEHSGFNSTKVSISADGKMALAATDARTVHLWDLDSGQRRGAALVHPAPVWETAFSGDGRTAMTRTNTHAHLWDAATGLPIGKPIGDSKEFGVVILSPDGATLLTAGSGDNKPAQLWEVASGQPKGDPLPHEGTCEVAAFSPEGRVVVTGGNKNRSDPKAPARPEVPVADAPAGSNGRVQFWDVATGKPACAGLAPRFAPKDIQFRLDGNLLMLKVLNVPELWCVPLRDPGIGYTWSAGTALGGDKKSGVHTAFGPDLQTVLISHADKSTQLWNTRNKPLGAPLKHPAMVRSVSFSPDGRILAAGCIDGTIRLWELTSPIRRRDTWTTSKSALDPGTREYSAISSDGQWLLDVQKDRLTGSGAGLRITLWDVNRRELMGQPLELGANFRAAAFSPDGRKALVSTVPMIPTSFHPDGRPHTWTGAKESELWLWEAGAWKRAAPSQSIGSWVRAIAFDAEGKSVLLGTTRGEAQLWDVAAWRPLGTPMRHEAMINAVALSPDGSVALTGGGQEVRLWRTATGGSIGKPLSHQGEVLSAAFSPDGQLLATGSGEHTARFWDVATGQQVSLPLHHKEAVTLVAFETDGRTLLTAGASGISRWDVRTGKLLGPPLPVIAAQSIVASPAEDSLLFASHGNLQRWERSVRPLPGDPARLALWSEVVSGRDLDGANVAGWLSPAKWQERQQRLLQHGGTIRQSPEPLDWHRRQTRLCMADNLWSSAQWHLDHLIAAEPAEWKHYLDRGRVRNGPELMGSLGLRNPELAIADCTRAIDLGAEGFEGWMLRGKAHAELRQWKLAAADYRKAAELSTGFWLWHRHANAEREAGDREAYRRACTRLLERFGNTQDHEIAYHLSDVCLDDRPTEAAANPIVAVAEKALAGAWSKMRFAYPGKQENLDVLSAALYCAGRFEHLIQRLDQAMKDPELIAMGFPASSLSLRALAHHRLGQEVEARRWLNLAITRFVLHDREYAYSWISTELEAAFGMRLVETSLSIKDAIQRLPMGSRGENKIGEALAQAAWSLVSHQNPQARDPKRAVVLARLAVDHIPQSILAWQQLGWVEYRAGNWKASIEALTKSCELEKGGDCGQWIVLALSRGKLAVDKSLTEMERTRHRAEARLWYEAAARQVDGWNKPPPDEVGRAILLFRREAAELLDEKPKPK